MHLTLGNYERVEKLVNSLDVNKQNNVGDTALIRASETGNFWYHKIYIQKLYNFFLFR